jgi:hypothetical protein
MQIHSSELALQEHHLISRLPTLTQKENAKIHSTLAHPPKQFVDTMQCSTVIFLMLTLHSSDALTLIETQPPRNVRVTQLLQHTLEKVLVVMEEPINVFSVVTIWSALITFVVLN